MAIDKVGEGDTMHPQDLTDSFGSYPSYSLQKGKTSKQIKFKKHVLEKKEVLTLIIPG